MLDTSFYMHASSGLQALKCRAGISPSQQEQAVKAEATYCQAAMLLTTPPLNDASFP